MVASLVAVALRDSTGLFRGKNVTPGKSKAEPSIRVAAFWWRDVISAIPVRVEDRFNSGRQYLECAAVAGTPSRRSIQTSSSRSRRLKQHSNFNNIRVRSFILNGAPEKHVPSVPGLWRTVFSRSDHFQPRRRYADNQNDRLRALTARCIPPSWDLCGSASQR